MKVLERSVCVCVCVCVCVLGMPVEVGLHVSSSAVCGLFVGLADL